MHGVSAGRALTRPRCAGEALPCGLCPIPPAGGSGGAAAEPARRRKGHADLQLKDYKDLSAIQVKGDRNNLQKPSLVKSLCSV